HLHCAGWTLPPLPDSLCRHGLPLWKRCEGFVRDWFHRRYNPEMSAAIREHPVARRIDWNRTSPLEVKGVNCVKVGELLLCWQFETSADGASFVVWCPAALAYDPWVTAQ